MFSVSMYVTSGENVQNRKMKRNTRGKRKERRKEGGHEEEAEALGRDPCRGRQEGVARHL